MFEQYLVLNNLLWFICHEIHSTSTKTFDVEANCTGALGNVEYPFIVITSRSTLTQSNSNCKGPIHCANRTI